MDSARSGSICRHFLNGYCRFGSRCNYRHEWPDIIPSQICRYFQKGGCWYGDSCRYLHVPQPEVDAAAAGRRGSEPTVSASSVAYAPSDRRGSEPALLQSEVTSKQECSRSQLFPISNPQHNSGRLAVDIEEEQSQDTDTPISASWESVHSSEVAQASASDGGNEQVYFILKQLVASLGLDTQRKSANQNTAPEAEVILLARSSPQRLNHRRRSRVYSVLRETSSNETTEDGAAAAASSTQGNIEEMEAFLQSQNVTCGICMDKVYEKTPGNQVFGILPNCNHAFCLQCIMTWRKTKDLEPDVVKSCPQCRVRSAFYVPNKHWVEGQAKESLVAAFKEKFSKKRCRYYSRYRYCPFKTDCLYRHDKTPRRGSFPYFTEDEEFDVDLVSRFIAMTLLGGYDDDSDDEDDYSSFAIFLPEEYRV